ncbi:hypothetical protein T11_12253 [Trichinella zimbabwensis]|uniref:Uncharacterized protein n=1 Tax=Trichinella zimbabwensis TaxID=268475 RepID=A0A0V1H9T5_9BILA|nr:hypothetical protein T11_12253 [Trichinella zimbabwensis]
MHCKSVGRKKLPFSTVGRSPEKATLLTWFGAVAQLCPTDCWEQLAEINICFSLSSKTNNPHVSQNVHELFENTYILVQDRLLFESKEENKTMGETEVSTSHNASTPLSVADKDSLEERRCKRVKRLEEAKAAIAISNQVIMTLCYLQGLEIQAMMIATPSKFSQIWDAIPLNCLIWT